MPNAKARASDPDSPLAQLDEAIRVALFDLVADGPQVIEELTRTRPHTRTVMRWALSGRCGVKLKSVMVGRVRMTNRAWLMRFFEGVGDAGIV